MGQKRPDETYLEALLTCGSVREAANAVGVGRNTLYRKLADPEFRAELNRRRRDAATLALNKLRHDLGEYIDILKELAGDDHPDAIRLRATIALLENAIKSGDLLDLSDRVERLEDDRRRRRENPYADIELKDLGLDDD